MPDGVLPETYSWPIRPQKARKYALEGTLGRDFRDYFLHLLPKCKMLDLMKTDPDMPDSDVTLKYLMDNIWGGGKSR